MELKTPGKHRIRLVALSTKSSGDHDLSMTLNVNINVENSIKYIYLLISQKFTTYCRMILLFLSFFFLLDDSGTISSQTC